MADDNFTRCPGCATVYRVTAEQLSIRGGQVRCGQCKTIFDGIAQLIVHTPPEEFEDSEDSEARAHAPLPSDATASARTEVPVASAQDAPEAPVAVDAATVLDSSDVDQTQSTPQGHEGADAHAAYDVAHPDGAHDAPANAIPLAAAPDATSLTAATSEATTLEERLAEPRRPAASGARVFAYTLAILLLLAALAAQALHHFRDSIVAHWPAARPVLARLCDVAGCAVRPLRDPAMTHLSIEASDLQADTAHRGLLILTATLRNRASWAVAYPYLELTLTDAQDRVVVRRALAPADYAGGTVDLQRGISSNAEVSLKVFIDASATAQAGYRLYMFYP